MEARRDLEVTRNPLECQALCSDHEDNDRDDGTLCKSSGSGREFQNYVLDVAELLTDLCWSSSDS